MSWDNKFEVGDKVICHKPHKGYADKVRRFVWIDPMDFLDNKIEEIEEVEDVTGYYRIAGWHIHESWLEISKKLDIRNLGIDDFLE